MKCEILKNDNLLLWIDMDIYLTRCQINNFTILNKLSDPFLFLNGNSSHREKCHRLSEYLQSRISVHISEMEYEELLGNLELPIQSFSKEEEQDYRFLLSFLGGFMMEQDDIFVRPLQTEYLYFANEDSRFQKIYRWHP